MDEFLLVNVPQTRQPLINQGPGIVSVALTTATTPMDNFSRDTVELMQRMVTDDEKAQRSIAA